MKKIYYNELSNKGNLKEQGECFYIGGFYTYNPVYGAWKESLKELTHAKNLKITSEVEMTITDFENHINKIKEEGYTKYGKDDIIENKIRDSINEFNEYLIAMERETVPCRINTGYGCLHKNSNDNNYYLVTGIGETSIRYYDLNRREIITIDVMSSHDLETTAFEFINGYNTLVTLDENYNEITYDDAESVYYRGEKPIYMDGMEKSLNYLLLKSNIKSINTLGEEKLKLIFRVED